MNNKKQVSLLSEINSSPVQLDLTLHEQSPAPENTPQIETNSVLFEPPNNPSTHKLVRRLSKSVLEKANFFEQLEKEQVTSPSKPPSLSIPPGKVKEKKTLYEHLSTEEMIRAAVAQHTHSIYGVSMVGKLSSTTVKPRPHSTFINGSSKLDSLLEDAVSTMKKK